MIEIQGLTKLYGDFAAVQDLDLAVGDGEIMGIIGHNGAGKTTTLKMIVGLIEPTAGHVLVGGHDMTRSPAAAKRRIGYLPEESSLYDNLTVQDYLLFFSELYGMSRRSALGRIEELLTSLRLFERDRLTGQLSKGMKRKVAIARALLHDPDLLIFDEPNSGLDPLTSFFIIHYLKELRAAGKTILLSAHNLFHIEYICDRVAILRNGHLVVCDTMQAIRQSLGRREYEVIFSTDQDLDCEARGYKRRDGHYVMVTADINRIAATLKDVSDHGWALVNLSVQESALGDIYVNLMTA